MKVVVGLSGGVDSSVAAYQLKQQGHEVIGLFMKNWQDDDPHCSAEKDARDAANICQVLDIPFHAVNFSKNYWDNVFAYFLKEYAAGRTPNPDVLCNREIKFKAFLDYAKSTFGAEKIATGHYAGIANDNGLNLVRADDTNKDQTYFLYLLQQEALQSSLFPLQHLKKPEVRAIAKKLGFDNFDKKDSTGICFIGERRFRDFLKTYLPANPGEIQTENGQVIGQHQGLMYYTQGQRQGLNIGGVAGYPEQPWYVIAKHLEKNILVVAQGHDHPKLFTKTLWIEDISWINPHREIPTHCQAQIRYRQTPNACQLDFESASRCRVQFQSPQRAATPGQALVCYDNQICLGGGTITHAE